MVRRKLLETAAENQEAASCDTAALEAHRCLNAWRLKTMPAERDAWAVMTIMRTGVLILLLLWPTGNGFAGDTYWAARYSRFGGGRSPADLEVITRRFFEQTTLRRVSIHAQTVPDAFEQVQAMLRKSHAEYGLGCTMSSLEYVGYSRPCHVSARRITLVEVINRLAGQGGLSWDFSAAGALTFYPRKSP